MDLKILKGALIGGGINALINGTLQWFSFKNYDVLPISVDCITNNTLTVLSTAVPKALSLAAVLTLIAYFTIKTKKAPVYPTVIWLVLKHSFFTFGVVTALSVMWQYKMGTIEVSPYVATTIVALIGACVAITVNYLTISECSLE